MSAPKACRRRGRSPRSRRWSSSGSCSGVNQPRQVSDIYHPDPDQPGWYRWTPEGRSGFAGIFGDIRVMPLEPGRARVKIEPEANLNSATGAIHGGALAGYVDIVIFAGAVGAGVEFAGG